MKKYFPLILKLIAAIIMLQTLFFKFSAAEQSINLFTKIAGDKEAYMRIGTGVIELIASILLFVPRKTWLGALLALGTMTGAIMSHISILGIVHNNDNGVLFLGAVATFLASFILLFMNRKDIPVLGDKL
jgi:uncharacterized membrane protein YphA (DoxX/SURF4 family)